MELKEINYIQNNRDSFFYISQSTKKTKTDLMKSLQKEEKNTKKTLKC